MPSVALKSPLPMQKRRRAVQLETFLMNDWMALAASWLPFVVLIAVWVWLSKGYRGRGRSGANWAELYEQQVAETRRMNVFLERIAVSLEKRETTTGK
jgi:hypothetical protein